MHKSGGGASPLKLKENKHKKKKARWQPVAKSTWLLVILSRDIAEPRDDKQTCGVI